MTSTPGNLAVTTVNLGAPDPVALARFYEELLGWEIAVEDKHWVLLAQDHSGGIRLSFQHEPNYVPPVWPAGPGDQQMMMHLEIRADDLPAAVEHAVRCGARLAHYQPQDDVRVCLDPVGHPFCLWLG